MSTTGSTSTPESIPTEKRYSDFSQIDLTKEKPKIETRLAAAPAPHRTTPAPKRENYFPIKPKRPMLLCEFDRVEKRSNRKPSGIGLANHFRIYAKIKSWAREISSEISSGDYIWYYARSIAFVLPLVCASAG